MCHPHSDREDTGTLVAVRMLRLGAGTFTGSEISSHTHSVINNRQNLKRHRASHLSKTEVSSLRPLRVSFSESETKIDVFLNTSTGT